MKTVTIETPLGPMTAVADEHVLHFLEFENRADAIRPEAIVPGFTAPLISIQKELAQYFAGKLKTFKTPISYQGTPFQTQVWEALQKIPYGETRSYAALAKALGKETAYRAVANGCGANHLAIIIPCHRVINTNGHLGGFGGGLPRKKWLLNHERI